MSDRRKFASGLSASLAIFCALLPSAQAQAPTPFPPPTAPHVAALPANLHWVVTFSDAKRGNPAPPAQTPGAALQLTEVETVKVDKVERQTLSWSNGSKTTEFFVQGHRLYQDPASKRVSVFGAASGSSAGNEEVFPTSGWYGTSWIDGKNYKDVVKLGEANAYHYAEGERPPSGESETRLPPREAWIDVATKMPLAVRSDAGVARYKYLPPPGAPITLPPEFAKAWADYEGQMIRLQRMRMP